MKLHATLLTAALWVILFLAPAGFAQETWDGTGADDYWSTDGNWADDSAPASPYTGTVYFNNDGLGANVLTADRVVGSLFFTNSSTGGNHATDLGGYTLAISNGQLVVGRSTSNTVVTIANGTLQLGGVGAPADLYAGWENITVSPYSPVIGVSLAVSAAINAVNLRHLAVTKDDDGNWPGAAGCVSVMDLSGATITSGGVANKLRMSGNLTIGGPAGNWGASGTGTLKLPSSLTELEVGGYFVLGQHGGTGRGTIDFGVGSALNRFSVSNDFHIGGVSGKGWLVNWPTDVDVRIGNPGAPVNMLLGNASSYELPVGSYGVLALTNGSFVAYLRVLRMGMADFANMSGAIGILDLASCSSVQIGSMPNEVRLPELTLAGAVSGGGQLCYGRLSLPNTVTNVQIGSFNVGASGASVGVLEFGPNSQLAAFSVTNNFYFGAYGVGYISGVPTNGVLFTIGATNKPVDIQIGCGTPWSPASMITRLVLTNAVFSAHATDLRVGERLEGSYGPVTGDLNLTNSTLGAFTVAGDVHVGYSGNANYGYLRLPSGTMNVTSNFYIGDAGSGSEGLVQLFGTLVTVGESVHIQTYGDAKVWLNGTSAGFDLASSDSGDFTIAAGAKMDVVVQSDPAQSARNYWCLRMLGDQQAYIAGLTNSGAITLNTSAMSTGYRSRFGINYDGAYTVLGIPSISRGTLIMLK